MSALTVTPALRTDLRARAHALKPVIIIGADGLTEPVLAETERALGAHELLKIRVTGDDRDARIAIYTEVCDRLGAAPIQHIGKLLVVWRPAVEAEPVPRGIPTARRAAAGKAAATERQAARAPARPVPSVGSRTPATRPPARGAAGAAAEPAAPRQPRVPRAAAGSASATGKTPGAAPRLVMVTKRTSSPVRRPKPQQVLVRGNERVTVGGEVKRAKKRQISTKRRHQSVK